jgi:hypothetical protein
LLRLSARKEQDCADVDRLAAAHLALVESKIADLKRLAKELRRLNDCCEGGGRIADCRIIEALSLTTRASQAGAWEFRCDVAVRERARLIIGTDLEKIGRAKAPRRSCVLDTLPLRRGKAASRRVSSDEVMSGVGR